MVIFYGPEEAPEANELGHAIVLSILDVLYAILYDF